MTRVVVDHNGFVTTSDSVRVIPAPLAGSLYKGVVIQTRRNQLNTVGVSMTGVTCDVLLYLDMAGVPRSSIAPNCAVLEWASGMHEGEIWEPRATVYNLRTGTPVTPADWDSADPTMFDGDHVLVAFVEHSTLAGVILGAISHPFRDWGNDRLRLRNRLSRYQRNSDAGVPVTVAPARTAFRKFKGAVFGVDESGNFIIDTARAYSQGPSPSGLEPKLPHEPPRVPVGGDAPDSGVQTGPVGANRNLGDPVVPDPAEDGTMTVGNIQMLQREAQHVAANRVMRDGTELPVFDIAGQDEQARLDLGSATVSVAVAEHLQALYEELKAKYDALVALFNAHGHEISVPQIAAALAAPPPAPPTVPTSGPVSASGEPPVPIAPGVVATSADYAPDWNVQINSSQLKIPDTMLTTYALTVNADGQVVDVDGNVVTDENGIAVNDPFPRPPGNVDPNDDV